MERDSWPRLKASFRTVWASAVMLVVEDEPGLREMVADNFRFCGYHVLEAGGAGEANTAMYEQADIILLDWMLPDSVARTAPDAAR